MIKSKKSFFSIAFTRTCTTFALCGTLAISGCGFRPLYGTQGPSASPQVIQALATVSVPPLPNRKGMKLSRILNEKLRPRGVSAGAAYDLEVGLSERIDELGIRKDATSSRANFVLTARFYLRESGRRVFGDQVQSTVSYNILDDQYATVASQANAEHRAIQHVGEQMKTRLAIYFHNRLNP
jgi:LPS-assembly lipoprotein